MTWETLFDDLASGLETEWEYERAAREAERQRLRIAQLPQHARLTMLAEAREPVTASLRDGRVLTGELLGTGADWIALRPTHSPGLAVLPEAAVVSLAATADALRASIPASDAPEPSGLTARMTFGYIARDLARRRVPVLLHADGGFKHHGTIDRAGADHLDLAVHDREVARRASAVRAVHIVAFARVVSVLIEPDGLGRLRS